MKRPRVIVSTGDRRAVRSSYGSILFERRDGHDAMGVARWRPFVDADFGVASLNEFARHIERQRKNARKHKSPAPKRGRSGK